MENQNKFDKKLIGGLYKKTSKAGNVYYTGKVGDTKVMILKTKTKKSETSPDLLVYDNTPPEEQGSPAAPAYPPKAKVAARPPQRTQPPQEQDDGDIF